jgi:ATP-binding cassette subfamily B multidrug efflux pump
VRILRFLRGAEGTVVLILVLLVVQALCELSLPSYTSDIVDIGIQQGGIANATPRWIRPDTLANLMLFMTDEEADAVWRAYEPNDEGVLELTQSGSESVETLDHSFGLAMLALSYIQSNPAMDIDAVRTMLSAGTLSKEQIVAMRDTALASMQGMTESIVQQRAAVFVQAEYREIGIDGGRLQTYYLLTTGAKMLGLTILMISAAILVSLLSSRTSARIGMELRRKVFEKVMSFSGAELDKFSTASLITRSTNDIQQVQMISVMILRIVLYSPIMGIGGIVKASNTHTGMGWVIAAAVGAVMLVIGSSIAITMPRFRKMQTLVDRLNLVSREILTGIPVIRAFSREKHEEQRFDAASRDLMQTHLFTGRVMSFTMPMMMLVMNCISVMIVWVGAKKIDLGSLQVGEMMAFISYTMQIVMSFMMFTMMSISLPRASVAAARIQEVLDTTPSISDRSGRPGTERKQWQGVIEFEDVSFRFPGAEGDVLEHISFVAKPGQTTAIIGSTGSGKSALINLIPRFYDVTAGRITIDGVDIRDIDLKLLRSLLGYVPQRSVLFTGDIASNLKFSGDSISDEAMAEAAEIAQATEFIEQRPERFGAPIAQGGSNVSGGQRQRLSIARALAKKPRILLLDDSFSALDYRTETALRRALAEKAKDMTIVVVAQRISTILHADQIVVLDNGRIAGIGTHSDLLRRCKTYQEIAHSQLSEAELELKGSEVR